jgi:hypothetical protein
MDKQIYTIRGPFGEYVGYEWAYSADDALKQCFGPENGLDSGIHHYTAKVEG